jgi:hypothetical protein
MARKPRKSPNTQDTQTHATQICRRNLFIALMSFESCMNGKLRHGKRSRASLHIGRHTHLKALVRGDYNRPAVRSVAIRGSFTRSSPTPYRSTQRPRRLTRALETLRMQHAGMQPRPELRLQLNALANAAPLNRRVGGASSSRTSTHPPPPVPLTRSSSVMASSGAGTPPTAAPAAAEWEAFRTTGKAMVDAIADEEGWGGDVEQQCSRLLHLLR